MIYIHVPFCHRKCTYCAFHSVPLRGGNVQYVDALLREMELRRDEQDHPIRTLYFGGGTPSILPLADLQCIVEGLHRCFDLSQLEEFTLEANPEDLTADFLLGIKHLGVNRLSVGVQSFDDTRLRLLNRRHTAAQARDAIERARVVGFRNIGIDLIYGITSGSLTVDDQTLSNATHVSAYSLTVEPGTALALQVQRGKIVLPSEEEVVEQYYVLQGLLKEAGFEQYEVSNYARPGFESMHNSRYWDRTPYLGLGPGAHSFDGERRRWNVADNQLYADGLNGRDGVGGYYEEEAISAADAYNELLMTALRTTRGVALGSVPEPYRDGFLSKVQPFIEAGWIVCRSGSYCPTSEGLLHADGMAVKLFV